MELIKNMPKATALSLKDMIDYEEGMVASLTLASQPGVGMTLFAFDADESISTHAAGGDAFVYALEGDVEITIDGILHVLHAGDSILMPCGIPHALHALTRYKMLLVVVFPKGADWE